MKVSANNIGNIKNILSQDVKNFEGGNLRYFSKNWYKYTQDSYILDIISNGLKLDLMEMPIQNQYSIHPLAKNETEIVSSEIQKLLNKKVLVHTKPEIGQFVSGVFTRDKKDGNKRMILNLKRFNNFINYKHFKMESINNVINLLQPNVYMASIDLKDAFYSVPIHKDHQKYLKLYFNNLLQFTCMPNGYGPAMRVFTKITKVPFSQLRGKGHSSVVYVDDSYLQGDTYDDCINNILDTLNLLRELGFVIHPDKSVLIPSQEITFLGFVISSKNMTLTLTAEKKIKIKALLSDCLTKQRVTLRKVAKIIGNIVASFPAVTYGRLHYRHLERDKIQGLKFYKGDFEKEIVLSHNAICDIKWWINNIDNSCHKIQNPNPDITIHTDASLTGWGITDGTNPSRGLWHDLEIDNINVLELKAIEIGIYTYFKYKNFTHIRVMCDNITAISYINNMGGIKSNTCNDIAIRIWQFAIKNKFWISAAHIPGIHNTEADKQSRILEDTTEWQLNPDIFKKIVGKFGQPDIDLFASRINKHIDKYVSWHPDPDAVAVNAFSMVWHDAYFYIFPPFSIIGQVISKIKRDRTDAVLVVPDWPTQYWYPQIKALTTIAPLLFRPSERNLVLPHRPKEVHSLSRKMQLMAIRVILLL